jgi:hypothetical protein
VCIIVALLAACFTLVSCLGYYSTMKMEATCSSETSVDFQPTTRRYIPEDRTLHNHRCENDRSYTLILNVCVKSVFDAQLTSKKFKYHLFVRVFGKLRQTRVCRIKDKTLCTDGNVFFGICCLQDLRKPEKLE